MAELAYARGLGPRPARVRGSNPLESTSQEMSNYTSNSQYHKSTMVDLWYWEFCYLETTSLPLNLNLEILAWKSQCARFRYFKNINILS